MVTKIAVIGDVHLQGSTLPQVKSALQQIAEKIHAEEAHVVVYTGDIFHRGNISDRYASVGDLQDAFMAHLKQLAENLDGPHYVYVVIGNHDEVGATSGHALKFLEYQRTINNMSIRVIDKPFELDAFEICSVPYPDGTGDWGVKLGFLPWVNKARFVAKHCIGLSKDDAQAAFNEATERMLGIFNFGNDSINLLFGHCEVAGSRQGGYMLIGGCYEFTEDQLTGTGADVIALGHIHKRQGFYCGAICQTNFGEEGNPAGFDILELHSKKLIDRRFVPIDCVEYHTVDIRTDTELHDACTAAKAKPGDKWKFRLHGQIHSGIEAMSDLMGVTFERISDRPMHVARTEAALDVSMSDADLLAQYYGLNPTDTPLDSLRVKIESLEVAQ